LGEKDMPKLYIANCSKQDFNFTWCDLENPQPFMRKLRAGSQTEIDGSPDRLSHIVKQHEVYGMMEASKVKKGFGGIAYRLDKPISVDAIYNGIEQKDQEAIDRALEARKVTAAAADQVISAKAQEMGLRQKSGIEVEVLEEKRNAADQDAKLNETIEVIHEGSAPRKGRSRKN
jgi:hypothetical protein